jgi:hypothetical protein
MLMKRLEQKTKIQDCYEKKIPPLDSVLSHFSPFSFLVSISFFIMHDDMPQDVFHGNSLAFLVSSILTIAQAVLAVTFQAGGASFKSRQ